MSTIDSDQPPAKKRRFFVEQSPISEQVLRGESGLPDQSDVLVNTPSLSTTEGRDSTSADIPVEHYGEANGREPPPGGRFDEEIFQTVTGEKLDSEMARRLREAAGDDMERGRFP